MSGLSVHSVLSPRGRPRLRRGFTLLEALVVISVIGLVAALLLPAVASARASARKIACQNNLRQIALAIHNYEGSFGCYPPVSKSTSQAKLSSGGSCRTWTGRSPGTGKRSAPPVFNCPDDDDFRPSIPPDFPYDAA